jgi:hypothetical protein
MLWNEGPLMAKIIVVKLFPTQRRLDAACTEMDGVGHTSVKAFKGSSIMLPPLLEQVHPHHTPNFGCLQRVRMLIVTSTPPINIQNWTLLGGRLLECYHLGVRNFMIVICFYFNY